MLFSFSLFLFLVVIVHPLMGEEDYLTQMGVLRLNETIYAPSFILSDLEGKKMGLSEFKGKFVMLNFWATW